MKLFVYLLVVIPLAAKAVLIPDVLAKPDEVSEREWEVCLVVGTVVDRPGPLTVRVFFLYSAF